MGRGVGSKVTNVLFVRENVDNFDDPLHQVCTFTAAVNAMMTY